METVRMLLDRGLIIREGNVFRSTGPIETLEVPETLQALIAARLDGLATEERRLLQRASVLGKSFTLQGLAAVTGIEESQLESTVSSLVHKEVLGVTTDPMSPERGQYGFLQDLVKKVAYDTMSRRERKAGHLAAAAYLLGAMDEDEIVEVVAAHYLDAFQAEPNADDSSGIRETARDMLIRAAERAASLGANAEAQRSLEHATELTDGRLEQAGLLERAGRMARAGGRAEEATSIYERSIALFESQGATHPAARVSARLAEIMWDRGRLGEGVRRMEEAFAVLSQEEPDGDLATVAATLARLLFFSGRMEDSAARVEVALEIAEAQGLPEVLSQALNTKSLTLLARGRQREALALLRYALDVALDHEIPTAALRAYYNLTDAAIQVDAYREARERVVAGLALARRVGHRDWEWQFIGQMFPQAALGEWDDVLQRGADLPFEAIGDNRIAYNGFLATIPSIHVRRGQLSEATQAHAVFSDADVSDDVQERSTAASGRAIIARAEGRRDDALRHAREALDARVALGIGHEAMKDSVVEGVEAALALGRFDEAEELLGIVASIPPGRQSPYLDAQSRRLNARIADIRGDEAQVEAGFKRAAGMLRELETPFWMAVTLLEYGEWLVSQERAEDANHCSTRPERSSSGWRRRRGSNARTWFPAHRGHRLSCPAPQCGAASLQPRLEHARHDTGRHERFLCHGASIRLRPLRGGRPSGDDLFDLRNRERPRTEVLRQLWDSPVGDLRQLRDGQRTRDEVLRRVRLRARRSRSGFSTRPGGRRACRPSGGSSPCSSRTSSASRRSRRAAMPEEVRELLSALLRHTPGA